jgi:hypothetical protein
MDHRGWYDRIDKERSFKKIEDIIFVSAMGPPGGGRVVYNGTASPQTISGLAINTLY